MPLTAEQVDRIRLLAMGGPPWAARSETLPSTEEARAVYDQARAEWDRMDAALAQMEEKGRPVWQRLMDEFGPERETPWH